MSYICYVYTLLYIEKEQKQAGKGRAKGQTTRKKENQGSASTVCHPSRLVLVLFLQVVMYGKGNDRPGRERTRAKDAADLFARSSPLLLLRLMPPLSTPSPAAHHFARLCQRLDGLPSSPHRPRSLPSCGEVGQSKRNRKRENQGERCRRHLRQFLASLLLRLMSTPSTPSPAARPLTRSQHRTG